MRERLDEVDSLEFRKVFKNVFAVAQRGKVLEQYQFLNGYYLMPIDGTGFFSLKKIHCENCCVKKHRDGTKTYYHQMVCGAIVHPDLKTVIPFAPEPVVKNNDNIKNDCEALAYRRYLMDTRREHPHLNLIILGDCLDTNNATIQLLRELKMGFILNAKPKKHKALFKFAK